MEVDYDFNGCLRLTDVVEDFFFSPSTNLYVFKHPLIVDERVLRAASELDIKVEASPEKWLVNIRLSDVIKLLNKLGSTGMSLPEYFMVRRDAIKDGDEDMVSSLESEKFIEMLLTVFMYDEYMVHNPESESPLEFSGSKIPVTTPEGRYGWFDPDKVDTDTGLPLDVKFERNIEDDTYKYWDTHTDIGKEGALMAVRGFVTSVGKISLDLGFPADAISHRLSIRECARERPSGALDEEILDEAKAVLSNYYRDLDDKSIYKKLPGWHIELIDFIHRRKAILKNADDIASQVLKDDISDILGVFWSLAKKEGNADADRFRDTARSLSGLSDKSASDDLFLSFIATRSESAEEAVLTGRSIVFVMGHKNPDTDTIVSAMAEAYRQHLLQGNESVFIPVVPGDKMPDEATELLGEKLSVHMIFTDNDLYKKASGAGRPEWIMVDHNIGPQQPDTRAIIDHHYPSEVSLLQQIPRRVIFAGSTSALVAQRMYGLGIEIPQMLAKILHGATLMDTENRFIGKMTPLDDLIMDRLKTSSGIEDESKFYRKLMRKLISCYDPDVLFIRDYKEDWSFFGFAVAKGIKLLSDDNNSIVDRLRKLASENNSSKNLPLTILKIVDYADNAETIRKERVYPVFIEKSSDEFKEAVSKAVVTVIKHESGDDVQIEQDDDFIEYRGVGTQLSRKKLAPVLELVVNAYNQYFFSPSTSLFFKRDFLKTDKRARLISRRHGIDLHHGDDGIVVGNPAALKFFLQELGFLCASPSEYFRAYFDALNCRDIRMISHLTSSRYLETLDAIIENKKVLVEHPDIVINNNEFSYTGGNRKKVKILKGEPGLINPESIDLETGLPGEVHDPRQYGTGLWRYWSPDSDCAWVLRSTIFAYDMPALDLKFHFREVLPRLTIRPCLRSIKYSSVDVYEKDNSIVVDIRD